MVASYDRQHDRAFIVELLGGHPSRCEPDLSDLLEYKSHFSKLQTEVMTATLLSSIKLLLAISLTFNQLYVTLSANGNMKRMADGEIITELHGRLRHVHQPHQLRSSRTQLS